MSHNIPFHVLFVKKKTGQGQDRGQTCVLFLGHMSVPCPAPGSGFPLNSYGLW